MLRFRVDFRPPLDQLARRVDEANRHLYERLDGTMKVLGTYAQTLQRNEAPKRTGRFAASIGVDHQKLPHGARFTVGAGVGQGTAGQMFGNRDVRSLATWIIGGTRPHAIVGNPLLAFYWEKVGEFVITHSVRHPGTKPNDYVYRAFKQWEPRGQRALERVARLWADEVSG